MPISEAAREGRIRKARADRKAKIAEILSQPLNADCHCQINPEMTDEELIKLTSCRDPQFICPTLVRVRSAVGVHERQED